MPTSTTAGLARINTKEKRQGRRAKKRKGIEAPRGNPPTPSWAIDALIGNKEHYGKPKKEKAREQANSAILDHSVFSYDLHGLYGEPILTSPSPWSTRGEKVTTQFYKMKCF